MKHRLLLLMILALTGCGFHLKGTVDSGSIRWLNHVCVVIQEAHQDLGPMLQNQLKAYGIQVTTDPSLAQYWLIIEREDLQQTISSISSSTTPRQYEITYILDYKLQQAKGAEVIPTNRIIITRQITLNSDRILGSKDESELQKSEMRRDAVIQILNRLSCAAPRVKPHPRLHMQRTHVN
jgi:LPS-assembly lipoprotein